MDLLARSCGRSTQRVSCRACLRSSRVCWSDSRQEILVHVMSATNRFHCASRRLCLRVWKGRCEVQRRRQPFRRPSRRVRSRRVRRPFRRIRSRLPLRRVRPRLPLPLRRVRVRPRLPLRRSLRRDWPRLPLPLCRLLQRDWPRLPLPLRRVRVRPRLPLRRPLRRDCPGCRCRYWSGPWCLGARWRSLYVAPRRGRCPHPLLQHEGRAPHGHRRCPGIGGHGSREGS